MNEKLIAAAAEKIRESTSILIVSHLRPDGDAVGSLIGLGLALQEIGKDVQLVLADGLPSNFKFLSGAKLVKRKAKGQFDLTIALDSADQDRVGGAIEKNAKVDINIDHHPTNPNFAEINLIDAKAVATAAILAEHLPTLGLVYTQQIAEALLTGILADSQGFRTRSSNSVALRIAADLVDLGANLPDLYAKTLLQRSYEATHYWGAGLSNMQYENGIVWTTLSMAERQAVGYNGRDDADLISVLASIDDISAAIIFIEQNPKQVKVSWRSQSDLDVARIAAQFGGGGHFAAAGAMLDGTLEEVKNRVLEATMNAFSLIGV